MKGKGKKKRKEREHRQSAAVSYNRTEHCSMISARDIIVIFSATAREGHARVHRMWWCMHADDIVAALRAAH